MGVVGTVRETTPGRGGIIARLRQDHNDSALWDGRVAIAGGQGFFHVSSIKVNIGLAAEFTQRGHNVIGKRSGPLIFAQAAFAEKFAGVNGRPNPNPDLRGAKHPGAKGLALRLPIMATGMIGTSVAMATRAAPVLPR